MEKGKKYISMLIALGAAYVITGVLLLIMALVSFKIDASDTVMMAMVTAIYLLSTAIAGFIAGKGMVTKRYLWGMLVGVAYATILCLISICIYKDVSQIASRGIVVTILCAGGGMLGGMIS